MVHSTTQVASQDIRSNQVNSGEGSSCDTKGKRKKISEDELAMKDSGRKERKNGHFKKRCETAKCEFYDKTHTGICFLKTGACFKYGKLGHQMRHCSKQMNYVMVKLL